MGRATRGCQLLGVALDNEKLERIANETDTGWMKLHPRDVLCTLSSRLSSGIYIYIYIYTYIYIYIYIYINARCVASTHVTSFVPFKFTTGCCRYRAGRPVFARRRRARSTSLSLVNTWAQRGPQMNKDTYSAPRTVPIGPSLIARV